MLIFDYWAELLLDCDSVLSSFESVALWPSSVLFPSSVLLPLSVLSPPTVALAAVVLESVVLAEVAASCLFSSTGSGSGAYKICSKNL